MVSFAPYYYRWRMAFFRMLPNLHKMLELFSRDESWLICINADPDAMASALALRRIMSRRVKDVRIARVNTISRPDNLAMVRYTRLDMEPLTPELAAGFQKFAMVDSQPDHHPGFAGIHFSIVIDHHPVSESSKNADYRLVCPEYGAASTMLTKLLYNLHLRPGKLLATALLFGIKTDTNSFERHCSETDLRAYQYLADLADRSLMNRIIKSEFHIGWLKFFARACGNLYGLGNGQFSYVGEVESGDILVNIADFFMRVYEVRWVAVGGVCGGSVIVVFRSDGIACDAGTKAKRLFGEYGSAGGHKTMARTEFPLAICADRDPEIFLWQQFKLPAKKNMPRQHQSVPPLPVGAEQRETPHTTTDSRGPEAKTGSSKSPRKSTRQNSRNTPQKTVSELDIDPVQ